MDTLKNIGERFRDARKAVGMAQKTAAYHTGISRTIISSIERGDRAPSVINLMSLCEIYGVTPNDLLLPEGGG